MRAGPTSQGLVGVLLPVELYSEIILRTGRAGAAESMIEHAIRSFLKRTEDEPGLWSETHYERRAEEAAGEETTFGDPRKGYQWGPVFLPNGTLLRMTYGGKEHSASVKNETITHKGTKVSPSELCSRIAANTSRNAWRDLYVKRPTDQDWMLATVLRDGIPGAIVKRQ